jgi:hypothetical protein
LESIAVPALDGHKKKKKSHLIETFFETRITRTIRLLLTNGPVAEREPVHEERINRRDVDLDCNAPKPPA